MAVSPITLSPDQARALSQMEASGNVFLTGAAGSGKSTLVHRFLRGRDPKSFPVLASTGAAAILVGGRTFHSFFGLGIMQGGFEATVERAARNKRLLKRIEKAEGVVIDEISMLSGTTLRAAERIARLARAKNEAWGGLRVIAVGDFAQLPPVSPYGMDPRSRVTGAPPIGRDVVMRSKDWAFLDTSWVISHFMPAVLKTILRTSDEPFLRVLNQVREGAFNRDVAEFLRAKCRDVSDEVEATRLFPLRDTTEKFNLRRLEQIPGEVKEFPTEYIGEERYVNDLKRNAPVPEMLRLKEGALVMLRVNDPQQRWVNGSLAHVREIRPAGITVQFLNSRVAELEPMAFSVLDAEGKEVAAARNFPVNLAYATTIHKAQGMTLDQVVVDLRNLWEPGHAYVALSRVKTSEGLTLTGWTSSSIKADPAVARFNREIWDHEPAEAGQTRTRTLTYEPIDLFDLPQD